MARLKNPRKWSKAQRDKYAATLKSKNHTAKPLEAHYVGEVGQQPAVDVRQLEERAFRRGMFTALQMTIDALVRELR
jgi:hypothetical protein